MSTSCVSPRSVDEAFRLARTTGFDGVEVMDVAWNMRREHLPVTQRSHYVITNGGGQPNIVPDLASVWYYFRDLDFGSVRDLYTTGNEIADAAAKATGGVGIDKEQLETIRSQVTEGTSALFVVTEEGDLDRVGERFHGTHMKLVHTNLTKEERDLMLETFGEE